MFLTYAIALLWIMDSYFSWKQQFYVKSVLMMDLFLTNSSFCLLQMLTDGLEWCGLLVDYCDVFISCLDSHSDGTHSLQRIHCWAGRNATFLLTWWRIKLIYIWDGFRAKTCFGNFHCFWWTISLKEDQFT